MKPEKSGRLTGQEEHRDKNNSSKTWNSTKKRILKDALRKGSKLDSVITLLTVYFDSHFLQRLFIEEYICGFMNIKKLSMLLIISCCTFTVLAVTNYSIFERTAFAIDNCDASSTCNNNQTGTGNS